MTWAGKLLAKNMVIFHERPQCLRVCVFAVSTITNKDYSRSTSRRSLLREWQKSSPKSKVYFCKCGTFRLVRITVSPVIHFLPRFASVCVVPPAHHQRWATINVCFQLWVSRPGRWCKAKPWLSCWRWFWLLATTWTKDSEGMPLDSKCPASTSWRTQSPASTGIAHQQAFTQKERLFSPRSARTVLPLLKILHPAHAYLTAFKTSFPWICFGLQELHTAPLHHHCPGEEVPVRGGRQRGAATCARSCKSQVRADSEAALLVHFCPPNGDLRAGDRVLAPAVIRSLPRP